ncbi:hypothetical protein DRO54_06845 [Candidatus Bathyarchaeota archaeon]|nr:MAG: hypothetical protein DRO54_06845 [Candidatus Bathyarchaeota archaeon]
MGQCQQPNLVPCDQQTEQPVQMGLLDQIVQAVAQLLGISEDEARKYVLGFLALIAILIVLKFLR